MPDFKYKSFCWKLGNTSFRTAMFNLTIEQQLRLLIEFRQQPGMENAPWDNATQLAYYLFMKEREFVSGDAPNKEKDAREKTSGLVDIGLITNDRRPTEAGRALGPLIGLTYADRPNPLRLAPDSRFYLKQLLKTSVTLNGGATTVRPFIVVAKALIRFGHLTHDEFRYLIPLCTDPLSTDRIFNDIDNLRAGATDIDTIILQRLNSMTNYVNARRYLKSAVNVDAKVIATVGMNRDGANHDLKYFPLYEALLDLYVNGNRTNDAVKKIYHATKAWKTGKIGTLWRTKLFDTSNRRALETDGLKHLRATRFDGVNNLDEFNDRFFDFMHLIKARSTLSDYFDLNRRYLSTTGTILFSDNKVEFDMLPGRYFKLCIDALYADAFTASPLLERNCAIEAINPALKFDPQAIIDAYNAENNSAYRTIDDIYLIDEQKRYERFNDLVNNLFPTAKLIELLGKIKVRDDKAVQADVTGNADVPTIFEYLLGVAWYSLSGRSGKILDFMKLSLDADLLPVTHAGGGEADIVYEYPDHTLLIEGTLAERTNQRRMEMEPVSRHLGTYRLKDPARPSYCVFVTTNLDPNVISDFRSRKDFVFYDTRDTSRYVKGLNIIPLDTDDLSAILRRGTDYADLRKRFDDAYADTTCPLPLDWYNRLIKTR